MRLTPILQRLQSRRCARSFGVKKITEQNNVCNIVSTDQCVQHGQIMGSCAMRHRHATGPERRRFAKMDVCHDQDLSLLPQQCALRQQDEDDTTDRDFLQAIALPFDVGICLVLTHFEAAFSSSFSMRSTRSLSFSVDSFSRKRSTISGNPKGVARVTLHTCNERCRNSANVSRKRCNSSSCSSTSVCACVNSKFAASCFRNTSKKRLADACN